MNDKFSLTFYTEHPDQAKSKLYKPDRVIQLRNNFIDYIEAREIGPKVILNGMMGRAERWARGEYADEVNKRMGEYSIRDFRLGKSNLIMPSRLLVHIYIWTSHPPYRDAWGGFHAH